MITDGILNMYEQQSDSVFQRACHKTLMLWVSVQTRRHVEEGENKKMNHRFPQFLTYHKRIKPSNWPYILRSDQGRSVNKAVLAVYVLRDTTHSYCWCRPGVKVEQAQSCV